jgi:hypothetical protein
MSGSMTPTITTPVVDALSTAAAGMGILRHYDRSSPLESPGAAVGGSGLIPEQLAQASEAVPGDGQVTAGSDNFRA